MVVGLPSQAALMSAGVLGGGGGQRVEGGPGMEWCWLGVGGKDAALRMLLGPQEAIWPLGPLPRPSDPDGGGGGQVAEAGGTAWTSTHSLPPPPTPVRLGPRVSSLHRGGLVEAHCY